MSRKIRGGLTIEKIAKEYLCDNSDHPEYNGQFCLCCGCLHDDSYCTEDPCGACDGPATECNYDPDKD